MASQVRSKQNLKLRMVSLRVPVCRTKEGVPLVLMTVIEVTVLQVVARKEAKLEALSSYPKTVKRKLIYVS